MNLIRFLRHRHGFLVLVMTVLLWCTMHSRKNVYQFRTAFFVFNELRQTFWRTPTENEMEFNYDYDSLIAPLNIEKSRMPALPYISGDTLRGFANHFFDNPLGINFKPEAVKSGHIIFVEAFFLDHFFKQQHSKINNSYILLTHNSDCPAGANKTRMYLDDPKMIAWFGQNVISKHPKLHAVPIGVANAKWPHGNVPILKAISKQLKPFHRRKTLLYINFNSATNPNRDATQKFFWNIFGNDSTTYFANKRTSWEEYMLQLGDTQFVISPPGNGIDCHRTWEALIMGAVPIVQRSELQSLYDDMPVMVVNDWKEVTKGNLLQFPLAQLNLNPGGVPRRPKIWARFWLTKLQALRSNYKSSNST